MTATIAELNFLIRKNLDILEDFAVLGVKLGDVLCFMIDALLAIALTRLSHGRLVPVCQRMSSLYKRQSIG